MPRGILPFTDYVDKVGTEIDVLLHYCSWLHQPHVTDRAYTERCRDVRLSPDEESRSIPNVTITAYGQTFFVKEWVCVYNQTVQNFIWQFKSAKKLAIYGYRLYALGNDWRFNSWEHKLVRQAYKWREDTVGFFFCEKILFRYQSKFVSSINSFHLFPLFIFQIMSVARKYIADNFGDSPFIAIHWRRGDWKNRVNLLFFVNLNLKVLIEE